MQRDTEQHESDSLRPYAVVAGSFTVNFVTWGTFFALGVFLVPMEEAFGWSRTVITSVYTINLLLFGLVGMVTGGLVNRFGPRNVVSVCIVAFALGLFVMSRATSVLHLYVGLGVLVGIGLSGTYVPLTAVVARWFLRRRGTMTGIVVAGAGIGGLVAPIVANALISSFDWRTAFAVLGAAVLVLGIIALFGLGLPPDGYLPEEDVAPIGASGDAPPVGAVAVLRAAVRERPFWLLCGAWFLHGLLGFALVAHFVAYAQGMDVSEARAATALGLIGGAGVAGSILMGMLVERIGTGRGIVLGFVGMACAFLALVIFPSPSTIVVIAIGFGLAFYGIAAIIPLVVGDLFGAKTVGPLLGVIEVAWAMGGAFGPILLGAIFDTLGTYRPALVGSSALAIVAVALVHVLRQQRSLAVKV